ncbi:mucin-2 isoform X2 [Sardina pilchardus]|uniref:mucin-2 isoform X2 n=1 Tax=Sardina pilchardus TaxID=27697 RepID=UPI002E145EA4
MSYGAVYSQGLLSQQYPPALLPKPGKDNARLQKLLKKSAKKKAAQQSQQMPHPFRSSLSPVNEASPDLEHSDHSTPPRTPETPSYATLHPRFSVRPLYQHVASPYPHHKSFTYGKTARFSPQPYGALSQPVARAVTPLLTYTPPPRPAGVSPGPGSYAEAHTSLGAIPASPVTPVTPRPAFEPAPEISSFPATKPASEAPPVPVPVIVRVSPAPVPAPALVPVPVSVPVPAPAQTVAPIKYLTPITLVTHKAPSPKFNAYEALRASSRPMFEVPQITVYTAKTSYYETVTAPLHETTEGRLSYYGRSPSPRPRSRTPTPEPRRGTSPMRLLKPTTNGRRGTTPTSEIRGRTTPTSEVKRGTTPTSEMRGRTTPSSEVQRGTTPTSEMRGRATPTSETRGRTIPISEVKRGTTPTSEMRGRATPTSDVKKEYEGRRSKTPTSLSVSGEESQKPLETEPPKVSIPLETQESIPKTSVTEPSPATATSQPAITVSSAATLRPKTPTQEVSKPVTPKTGYQQPKVAAKTSTPSAGSTKTKSAQSFAQALKPIIGVRPKTPTHGGARGPPKTYYGLTPAAYVAHGGIQTMAPSYSISRPRTPTAESPKPEEQKGPEKQVSSQEPPKVEVPSEQQLKTTVTEAPTQKSTETKASLGAEATRVEVPSEQQVKTTVAEAPTQKHTETKASLGTEAPRVEVPSAQQVKTTVAEAPTQKSTPTKAFVGAKPQEAKKSPALLHKTKPVPVVERAKPQVTEIKQAKSPAASTALKTSLTETPKGKTAIIVPPKPKTPTPGVKIPPAQKQIAAQSSKSKTSEKASDEPKKQDVKSKIVKEQSKVSTRPAVPKDSALETSTVKASGAQSISSILSPKAKISEPPKTDKSEAQPVTKSKEKPADKEKPIEEVKSESKAGEPTPTKTTEEKTEKEESAFPKAEPLLKVVQKPKGMMKSKLSGWSRLKKHMVVEVEEPKFPEQPPGSATEPKKEIPNGELPKLILKKKDEDEVSSSSQPTEGTESPRATKMWDCVLFQMFSTKENVMQQIMADKSEEEKKELEKKVATKPEEIPAFAHRLPVLLFSPRFDAKRLREAASRPVTKMSTVFEMALIGRHVKDDEPKQFNRTAKGFNSSKPTEA